MQTEHALRMLAALKGGYFCFDRDPFRWEIEVPRPSKQELMEALYSLETAGLVASIYERLDGPCYALSEQGRRKMEAEGFLFSEEKLSQTRRLFKEWLCEAPI